MKIKNYKIIKFKTPPVPLSLGEGLGVRLLERTIAHAAGDTILRGISELATANTTYTSDTGKSYDFNTATKLNSLLVKVLKNTGQLVERALLLNTLRLVAKNDVLNPHFFHFS